MSDTITNESLNNLLGIQPIQNLDLHDPAYTNTLNNNLQTLRGNIEKILSVPFLQGAQGESVLIGDFPLFILENNNLVPTDCGKAVLKALFPLVTTWDAAGFSDWENWRTYIDGQDAPNEYKSINNVHVYDNLILVDEEDITDPDTQIITVQFYYKLRNTALGDIDANRLPIQSASYFVFYDARLSEINSGSDSHHYFKDTSAALLGTYSETIGWNFHDTGILPTVYYSTTMGHYCWRVNGIDTGIVCEGLPGQDGQSATINLVKISNEPSGSGVNINEVYTSTDWSSDLDDYLTDNSVGVAVIITTNGNPNENKPNKIYFGVIFKNNSDVWQFCSYNGLELLQTISGMSLDTLLDSVGESASLQVLYVKDRGMLSDPQTNNICHALYSNQLNSFKISPINFNDRESTNIVSATTDNFQLSGYKNISLYSIGNTINDGCRILLRPGNETYGGIRMGISQYITPNRINQLVLNSNKSELSYGTSGNKYIQLSNNGLNIKDEDKINLILQDTSGIPSYTTGLNIINNKNTGITIDNKLSNIILKNTTVTIGNCIKFNQNDGTAEPLVISRTGSSSSEQFLDIGNYNDALYANINNINIKCKYIFLGPNDGEKPPLNSKTYVRGDLEVRGNILGYANGLSFVENNNNTTIENNFGKSYVRYIFNVPIWNFEDNINNSNSFPSDYISCYGDPFDNLENVPTSDNILYYSASLITIPETYRPFSNPLDNNGKNAYINSTISATPDSNGIYWITGVGGDYNGYILINNFNSDTPLKDIFEIYYNNTSTEISDDIIKSKALIYSPIGSMIGLKPITNNNNIKVHITSFTVGTNLDHNGFLRDYNLFIARNNSIGNNTEDIIPTGNLNPTPSDIQQHQIVE